MTIEWRPIRDEYRQAKEAFVDTNGDDDSRAAWRAEAGILERLIAGRLIGRTSFPEHSIYDPGCPDLSLFESDGTISQAFWQCLRDARGQNKNINWAAGDFSFSSTGYAPNGDCVREIQARACEVVVASAADLSRASIEQGVPRVAQGGRRPAHWWPAFAEELAFHAYIDGAPEGGVGRSGQAEVFDAVVSSMIAKGQHNTPSLSSVEKIIGNVIERIRMAEQRKG